MVHLGPLPGAARFGGDLGAVVGAAIRDAEILESAGFDGLMIENFGDAPFYADDVPKATVAAMTRAAAAIHDAVGIPIGVNVLRNDALAALAVAAAAGASYIRVNVLSGAMTTDQGVITGRAAEVARLRASLGGGIAVLADVFVKHAVPPPGLTIEQAAGDTFERAGADAVVVTGPTTGSGTSAEVLTAVRASLPAAPLYVGSGVAPESVAGLLELADGVIVGTSIKQDGRTTAPVDPERARRLVEAAAG
jgi:membrane complex biogenesis BtpA family protein